jgi:hypothetical protein
VVKDIRSGKTTLDAVREDHFRHGDVHTIIEYKKMGKAARSKAVSGTSDVKGLDDGSKQSRQILDSIQKRLVTLHPMTKEKAAEVYVNDVVDNIGKTKKSAVFADIHRGIKNFGKVPASTYAGLKAEDRMKLRSNDDIEGMDDGSEEAIGRIEDIKAAMTRRKATIAERKEGEEDLVKPECEPHRKNDYTLSFQQYVKRVKEANENHSYAQCRDAAKKDGAGWYQEYMEDVAPEPPVLE